MRTFHVSTAGANCVCMYGWMDGCCLCSEPYFMCQEEEQCLIPSVLVDFLNNHCLTQLIRRFFKRTMTYLAFQQIFREQSFHTNESNWSIVIREVFCWANDSLLIYNIFNCKKKNFRFCYDQSISYPSFVFTHTNFLQTLLISLGFIDPYL